LQVVYYLHRIMIKRIVFVVALLVSITGIAQVNFELRGVWIATVENIDWPAQKGLSVDEQKQSFIQLLNKHQQLGMNAIFMQIRPSGDAFYPSQYEPWSEYLTGKQGLPPTPYYDPLQFMIEETHKRGMEFHAWLNPYRAVFNINKSSIAPSHITRIHPEWFVTYGDKKYFNPGLPQVRNFVCNVVKDLVNRYDLDGIHMDDYFYPYRITGKEFPDEKVYKESGSSLNKDDWRRSNCDSIIENLYTLIRNTNSRVKFGISPFGVWRNKSQDPMGSDTKAGQTNYDDLYADILLWLKKGWIDYVLPQLYWERGHKLADYDVLIDWWNKHSYGKHIYIGHGIYRANSNEAWKKKDEIPNQLKLLRTYNTIQGSVYFSSKTFDKNPNGWNDSLQNNYYALPAIVPPMPWIDSSLPEKPVVIKNTDNSHTVQYNGSKPFKAFAVYALPNLVEEKLVYATLIKLLPQQKKATISTKNFSVPTDNKLFVAVVDENNNVSAWVQLL
jgi:uncharacterized lipoprotein YddW (UPF0748 family)